MTDAYFYSRWSEQEGWSDNSAQTNLKIEYFGGINTDPNRDYLTRIFDIDLPAGATITSASMLYYVYAKDESAAQNFTYDFYYEPTVSGGSIPKGDSTPLKPGTPERTNRNWYKHVSNATFNWNTTLGDNQTLGVDVTSVIQNAVNTNGGRHLSIAFKLTVLTESGDMGIGNNANGNKQRLLVQYTGGTPRTNEMATINENSNFTGPTGAMFAGAPDLWNNNVGFGTYQANPTYTVASSFSGIPAAPQGGNIFKITATEAKRAVAFHLSPNDLAWGQWYCWSIYAYVPSGVSDVQVSSLQKLFRTDDKMSTKDQWVRMYVPVLVSPDKDPFIGISSSDNMAIGDSFYLANFNFTKGNNLYPYFDGNTTDSATYQRNFDWGGTSASKRDGGIAYVSWNTLPSATGITPQPNASTYKKTTVYWTYSDSLSESQSRYRAEIRKKRVP